MDREAVNARIDEILGELNSFDLPTLIFTATRYMTHSTRTTDRGTSDRRRLASSAIAAHNIPSYRQEFILRNAERESLIEQCDVYSKLYQSWPSEIRAQPSQLVADWDLAARRVFAQMHFMSIASSMLYRLVCRAAAPFSCAHRLDDSNLRTLNCYEQMRDSMEHFDERLPGGDKQDWMTREEWEDGRFRIVHRFPDAGAGRIRLNGVDMEFTSEQVDRIILAVDELQAQIRAAVFRDLRKHLRRNHDDIPVQVVRLRFFEHHVGDIG